MEANGTLEWRPGMVAQLQPPWGGMDMHGSVSQLEFYLLAAFSIAAAVLDVALRRIPNGHVMLGAMGALGASFAERGLPGLLTALSGAIVGGALLLPGYWACGVAGGDVKTMAVVGAFAGPALAFSAVLMTVIAGGFIAIVWLVAGRAQRTAPGSTSHSAQDSPSPHTPLAASSYTEIPYGPAIAIGSLLACYRESLS